MDYRDLGEIENRLLEITKLYQERSIELVMERIECDDKKLIKVMEENIKGIHQEMITLRHLIIKTQ